MEKIVLAIDTSCDETSAAVVCGRKVLSNVISSQINIHKKYGGVFPALAKRAHQDKIDYVVNEAIKRASKGLNLESRIKNLEKDKNTLQKSRFDILNSKFPIDAIAVTQGPGLAIALEVGIRKAKEISTDYGLPLIAVNHLEGHLLSCLAQNNNGKPEIVIDEEKTLKLEDRNGMLDKEVRNENWKESNLQLPTSISSFTPHTSHIQFPVLGLIVSGGHTELVLVEAIGKYKVIGSTLDDACGEALDKGAIILKLGYPGGPIIERLAREGDPNKYAFNKTLKMRNNLQFSYSGIKTQLLYLVQSIPENILAENVNNLASSFQNACFEQILRKTINAIKVYQPRNIICGGGVMANMQLRKLLREIANSFSVNIYFPQGKKLVTDNAAMIGIAGYFKLIRNEVVENIDSLDREPRMGL